MKKIDKKSLFGLHRPAQAEIMPELGLSIDLMVGSMAKAGIKVNNTTNQRLWDGWGCPGSPKTAVSHSGGRKETDRPAAMDHVFA
jgi:hypothetical protein